MRDYAAPNDSDVRHERRANCQPIRGSAGPQVRSPFSSPIPGPRSDASYSSPGKTGYSSSNGSEGQERGLCHSTNLTSADTSRINKPFNKLESDSFKWILPSLQCQLICNSDRSGMALPGGESPEYRITLAPKRQYFAWKTAHVSHVFPVLSLLSTTYLRTLSSRGKPGTGRTLPRTLLNVAHACPTLHVPHTPRSVLSSNHRVIRPGKHPKTPRPRRQRHTPAGACTILQNTRYVCRELPSL